MSAFPATTSRPLRMSYRIGRGEQGVLTFEPYKSALLPLWRFRTPAIARASAAELWAAFERYHAAGDFVGMDMARKFIQMGMTRAARYANYKGGRKYEKGSGEQLEKSGGHEGMEGKREASEVFREVWGRCRAHEGYQRLKGEWMAEKKEWEREEKRRAREGGGDGDEVKIEVKDEDGSEDKQEVKHEARGKRRRNGKSSS